MDVDELKKLLSEIKTDVKARIGELASLEKLRQLESQIVGKKGRLGELLGSIGKFPKEARGSVGQVLNSAKKEVAELFQTRRTALQASESAADSKAGVTADPTLPGLPRNVGSVHPVTAVQWEVEEIFERLGFTIETGPEMESDYYNFEALNIPAWHPARDMQDTFWLENGMLLRTHTSPVQIRAMEKFGPPLRCIVPGRCFRYETIDASHENTFHQCEGLMIDKGISVANLIAVMKLLLREVFHRDVAIRLRPGYFPFVEPGFELDMSCMICNGDGCATCKKSGWIEILPCGMVHPNVLKCGGIDPHEYTGFAFGLGLTRLAMMKYGIRDIRIMNSGDLRGLVHPERLCGPLIGTRQC
ncbi:MAG: phenylalanine--tRNA ligase subunit alpha [Planctomycetes bacterium]|nr:phenylalanine--tRNA ligase subunit alpha [Planctomycetota bacterium]